NRGQTPPLYYYRTNNGLEVDLIIEEKLGRIKPCEIKLTKTPRPGMAQSMDRLRNLNKKKNFTISDGTVICLASGSLALTRNAKACPLKNFLEAL
ncbi:MAG: DUF4143 domain-containing protein, partial [Candidatus Omnitrophica bacterium]|nr:DUF4143 domain-containing protein [Candidatus Omnitrophota bacterium]